MVFQRTDVQFPAPTWQISVTPSPGHMAPSHKYSCSQNTRAEKTFFKRSIFFLKNVLNIKNINKKPLGSWLFFNFGGVTHTHHTRISLGVKGSLVIPIMDVFIFNTLVNILTWSPDQTQIMRDWERLSQWQNDSLYPCGKENQKIMALFFQEVYYCSVCG